MSETESIFREAVERYGALPQIGMLHEEMGELMTAINQWARGRVELARVAEEVADVFIMLQQLPFAVEVLMQQSVEADDFEDMTQTFFDQKVERLKMRMRTEGAE